MLNYLYEDASYVIDRRFSAVEEIMKENTDISNYLYAVWSYSQVSILVIISILTNSLSANTWDWS